MFDKPALTLKIQEPDVWRLLHSDNSGQFTYSGAVYNYTKISIFDNIALDPAGNDLIFIAKSRNGVFDYPLKLLIALAAFTVVMGIGAVFNHREYGFQTELVDMSNQLHAEKQRLHAVNQSLEEYIARQKLLQDELVETRKLASLGLMVSGVAHELNTPIGGASIALATTQRTQVALDTKIDLGITKNEYQHAIQLIGTNLSLAESNMQKAAERIKKFERLAIDRISEDKVECSLQGLIANALKTLQPLIQQNNISVRTQVFQDIRLFCPTGILTQVIENLVLNSINHGLCTIANGKIDILVNKINNNYVEIKVADNGTGIPDEIKDRLLEPFITNARARGNIGLGLYMVEQWVSGVLDGQLSFTSTQDPKAKYATVFTVKIPITLND